MFEITLGNFPPVSRLLMENVTEWFVVFSLLHKMSIGFAVVGVINGVILQETFKVAATDDIIMVRQKKKNADIGKDKMIHLFHALDTSGDGMLEFEEFADIAQDPDVRTWLSSMDIETDDLGTLFQLIDLKGNGTVTIDDLCDRIPRIKGGARSIDALALRLKLDVVVGKLDAHTKKLTKLMKTENKLLKSEEVLLKSEGDLLHTADELLKSEESINHSIQEVRRSFGSGFALAANTIGRTSPEVHTTAGIHAIGGNLNYRD
jgi:hypothetical protein